MKVLLLQAETVMGRRYGVLGMVAEDEEARARVAIDAAVGPLAQIVLCKSVQTSLPERRGQPRANFSPAPSPGGKKTS